MTKVAMSDFTGWHFPTGRGLSLEEPHPQYGYREGLFKSEHGFVQVLINPAVPRTDLSFIHRGRFYYRQWLTLWGELTIARLAREFADDVVDGRA